MELVETSNPTSCTTLCLNMIVKNESKIITRLLKSVLPIIDCYCICDTGSTDNTVEVIQDFFKLHEKPGKIVYEPFVNFAHNRNVALESCIGLTDYVLFLDADMVLEITKFDKKSLCLADSFNLFQGDDSFYYENMRIVKNNGLFSYIGVTHEYINCPPNHTKLVIRKEDMFIRDIGDGGAKSDKSERDIRLLKEGIEKDPRNDRYHFYLANSYYDLGKYNDAIEIYKKRIEIGGWEQEVWYSHYRIGICYKNLGNIESAIHYWLQAYNCYPYRIENIYEIVNHYRNCSQHKSAKLFYDIGKDILTSMKENNVDKNGFLFLHNDIYMYKFEYEYTIISAYLGIKNINNELMELFKYCDDGSIINNTMSNMKFYKFIPKPLKTVDYSFSVEQNVCGNMVKLNSSSACILHSKQALSDTNNTKYLMNIRLVNYRIDTGGNYLDCNHNIITSNKFLELDDDFGVIREKLFELNEEHRRYIGIEDIRIFHDDIKEDGISFIGTGYHKNERIGIVYGNYDTTQDSIQATEVFASFTESHCEKNWVYIHYKNKNHIVYKWSPLQIGEINKETNKLDLIETNPNVPKIFQHVRGSTCGFFYKSEYWFIVHIVSYESPRHYYHLFVVMDESMNFSRMSAPFKFEGEPIEYCIGLIVEDDRVIVPYSLWDNKTKIAVYDKTYIDSITQYTL